MKKVWILSVTVECDDEAEHQYVVTMTGEYVKKKSGPVIDTWVMYAGDDKSEAQDWHNGLMSLLWRKTSDRWIKGDPRRWHELDELWRLPN